jgi:hypothetical protein
MASSTLLPKIHKEQHVAAEVQQAAVHEHGGEERHQVRLGRRTGRRLPRTRRDLAARGRRGG